MPVWLGIAVHWIHVFCAIFWFGGTLYVEFVLAPALARSKPESASDVFTQIVAIVPPLLGALGGITILSGIFLGTTFGPIQSMSDLFGTPYGHTWLAALVLGIFIAAWGGAAVGRTAKQVPLAAPADRPAIIGRVVTQSRIMLVAFLLAYTCMVMMRFGL